MAFRSASSNTSRGSFFACLLARCRASYTTRSAVDLFPLRHAYSYQAGGSANAGAAGVGALSGNWTTPNPPIGAWITYNVKQDLPADAKLVLTISDNVANSKYNSLQVSVMRRYTQGLQINGSYTLAKNLDTTQ